MSVDRSFVDTNVLVYCFDRDEPEKRVRALETVEKADVQLVLSTQVLQEFYVTVTRKLARPLARSRAESALRELSQLPVVLIDTTMVLAAIRASREHSLSLWDSLILQAAIAGDCSRLLSEDLQDGFVYHQVRVENPFAEPA